MRHRKKNTVGVWLDRSRTMPDPSDQDPHSACLRSYKCLWRRPMVDSIPVLDSPILSLYFMGVTVETIVPGDGSTFPKKGDKVTIHYVGTLTDGRKFDSSRDRGSPFQTEIGTGKVIKGWDEGVLKLSLGQKAILTASPDFAYGSRGFPPAIPPNSTLKFEVELLKIN